MSLLFSADHISCDWNSPLCNRSTLAEIPNGISWDKFRRHNHIAGEDLRDKIRNTISIINLFGDSTDNRLTSDERAEAKQAAIDLFQWRHSADYIFTIPVGDIQFWIQRLIYHDSRVQRSPNFKRVVSCEHIGSTIIQRIAYYLDTKVEIGQHPVRLGLGTRYNPHTIFLESVSVLVLVIKRTIKIDSNGTRTIRYKACTIYPAPHLPN